MSATDADTGKDFAIIGGGSTGPMTLIYLARAAQAAGGRLDDVRIHLFDPNGFCNGGIAYGECDPEHRLNSVPDEMTPWDPDRFGTAVGAAATEFAVRAPYLPVLQEDYYEAIGILESLGVEFVEHKTEASVKLEDDGRYTILSKDGDPTLTGLAGEQIVLTVGYGPNQNFQGLWQHDGNGYVHTLYDRGQRSLTNREPKLADEAPRVAFMGSGPALYDFVNAYYRNPETMQLTVFSPSGERLSVRDPSIEAHEPALTPDPLIGFSKETTLDEAIATLTSEFTDAARRQDRSDRRIALDIMAHAKTILGKLTPDVAEAFRKSAEFKKLCHIATPIPTESDERLNEFDPEFVAACVKGDQIERLDDGTFKITPDNGAEYIVDVIINGTGHGRHNHPIFESLKSDGVVHVDNAMGVLATADDGYTLLGSNKNSSGIACIGPATHCGIDGMESFARPAEPLAQILIARMQGGEGRDRVPQPSPRRAPEQLRAIA